jgi:hypothetical protein
MPNTKLIRYINRVITVIDNGVISASPPNIASYSGDYEFESLSGDELS